METIQNKTTNKIVGIKNAGWVIICCFIIAVCIYHFILGNPSNFMNNDLITIRCRAVSWEQFTKVV